MEPELAFWQGVALSTYFPFKMFRLEHYANVASHLAPHPARLRCPPAKVHPSACR
jgi:hypothetical protein